MNLTPNSNFTLIRQLANPTDTATYYVQAVVRNIITGKTIQTIKLTNQGNQRFTAPYQVPADTSGLGTYISICTYVFDDAGYSVPDGNYETEDKEYLIIQPPVSTYGNGGSMIVDYDKIKKFISDIKFPGIPSYDKNFKELSESHEKRFSNLESKIASIKLPESEKYDDSGMKQSVASLQNEMRMMRASHESAMRTMAQSHAQAIAGLTAHHKATQDMMESKLSKIADRPYAAERDRDNAIKERDGVKQDYESLAKVIKSVQVNGKYEDAGAKQNTMEQRVKKLMGV